MHLYLSSIFLAVLITASSAGEARFRFERPMMGTRFVVVVYAKDHSTAQNAANNAFQLAEELNTVASDYLSESELSLLTSKPIGQPIPLSPRLFQLLDHSQRLAEATQGAFDPTLGPLTQLWRKTRDDRRLPACAVLQSTLARVGWRHFTLNAASQTIILHRPNMAFDLGGMAKGYAADLMLESLAANGLSKAMIAAGGDVRLGDPPPGRDGWRVALQTFDLTRTDEVLILANAAVSTSGDLHQSVEIDGIRYSHIVDPHTGLGLTRRLAATVIADEAKISDPLATAACVLGPDRGKTLPGFPGVRDLRWRTPQESPLPTLKDTSRQP
jgi:thiamine biosynthesis lipoprotein